MVQYHAEFIACCLVFAFGHDKSKFYIRCITEELNEFVIKLSSKPLSLTLISYVCPLILN